MRRLGHRPELDGLRGIAILLVMLGHLYTPGFASGGMTGVTLFFVLSGFLITSLLLEERAETGRISLKAFYRRRALRLLPALFALVVVANVIMAAAHDWGPTAWASLAAIFYFGNWISIADGHLSLTAGSLGPWLGHTWSLAIEEQFYLLWPMLLILFLRWGRQRPLVLFACAGVAASVIERLLLWPGPASPQSIHSATDASLQRIYHGTDTRMDALLLGSLLALGAFRWARRGFGRCAFAGALMLGTGTVLTGQEAHFVAAPTLAAVGGLVMLASLDQKPDQLLGRVLAVPPLRFTGRISYGLYIWHVPFKTLFMPHMAGDPLWMRGIVLFGFAYGAALLSHRYVEQPFLRLKRRVPTPSSLHREDEFPAVTVAA